MLAITTCASLNTRTQAEEGGAGHAIPGGMSSLIDMLPTRPGWVFEAMHLHYEGDAQASQSIPNAGLITLGLDATTDALTLGGFYTFEDKVLGSYYSLGVLAPYAWVDVNAQLSLESGSVSDSSSVHGIGDIALMPILMAWQPTSNWQIDAALMVYAPTGDYDAGRLANPGLNHWTFDPTVGAAYSNEEKGFNFLMHAGFAFSTENSDTSYTNGTVFHLDMCVQQLLPLGSGFLGIGVEGFYQEQITDDRGSGASLGGFRGLTSGVGPVLSYILPVDESAFVIEARWLPELDTRNRLEGDYFWLKAAYQF